MKNPSMWMQRHFNARFEKKDFYIERLEYKGISAS